MATTFGIREVCDVTLTPLSGSGNIIEIKTAKMSSLETTSTTVYAQGGRGNARLRAWEGEKAVTFTVEDALITRDQLIALTGATVKTGTMYVKTTSFAGEYKITATTLARGDDGNDYAATIVIPKAKLQSTLNLSMAPTGDPSSFTFTFDAFPAILNGEANVLFSMDISEEPFNEDNNYVKVILTYVNNENSIYATESLVANTDDLVYLDVDTLQKMKLTTEEGTILKQGEVIVSNSADPRAYFSLVSAINGSLDNNCSFPVTLCPGQTYEFWIA